MQHRCVGNVAAGQAAVGAAPKTWHRQLYSTSSKPVETDPVGSFPSGHPAGCWVSLPHLQLRTTALLRRTRFRIDLIPIKPLSCLATSHYTHQWEWDQQHMGSTKGQKAISNSKAGANAPPPRRRRPQPPAHQVASAGREQRGAARSEKRAAPCCVLRSAVCDRGVEAEHRVARTRAQRESCALALCTGSVYWDMLGSRSSKRNPITCSGAASARVLLVRAHLLVAYCN
jgi:hypothetical protein